MSGSITANGTTGSATATGGAVAGSGTADPLGSISNNFSSFLQLLMTQLQNQDPTSPLDTNQFTSELVQFTGVEQQINTNNSLKQLIQLTQAGEVVQSTGMLGHQVEAQSDSLTLQGGQAMIRFTAPAAGTAEVVVSDAQGHQVYAAPVATVAGTNTWTWNGQDSAGDTVADGAYRVAVTASGSGGASESASGALPFTILGKVTGVQDQGATVQLELGALPVDFSSVRSVLN